MKIKKGRSPALSISYASKVYTLINEPADEKIDKLIYHYWKQGYSAKQTSIELMKRLKQ